MFKSSLEHALEKHFGKGIDSCSTLITFKLSRKKILISTGCTETDRERKVLRQPLNSLEKLNGMNDGAEAN